MTQQATNAKSMCGYFYTIRDKTFLTSNHHQHLLLAPM